MMDMGALLIADSDDLENIIAGYLDALLPELQLDSERQSFVEHWVPPFAQMTRLLQDASATGVLDYKLLATFMRELAVAIDVLTGEVPEGLSDCMQPILH